MYRRQREPRPKTTGAVIVALIVAAVTAYVNQSGGETTERSPLDKTPAGRSAPPRKAESTPTSSDVSVSNRNAALLRAMASQIEAHVEGNGVVTRVLPDDDDGARHQKLLVDIGGGRTVLIAHNIDLAARVPAKVGDAVDFKGDFEPSDRGGVIHWTHRDPAGRHAAGWLKWNGKMFD